MGTAASLDAMVDNDLVQRRAEALYAVYKRALEQGLFSSLRNAADWLWRQPAPCYFISSEKASEWVGMVLAGKLPENLAEGQRRKAIRLTEEYLAYRGRHPWCGFSRDRIMETIVEMPAPEFYLSAEGVRRILRKYIREVRIRKGW